jgi:hypothetical protein
LEQQGHKAATAVLAVFSTEGFHPDLVTTARGRGDVLLVDLPVLLGLGDPIVVPGIFG